MICTRRRRIVAGASTNQGLDKRQSDPAHMAGGSVQGCEICEMRLRHHQPAHSRSETASLLRSQELACVSLQRVMSLLGLLIRDLFMVIIQPPSMQGCGIRGMRLPWTVPSSAPGNPSLSLFEVEGGERKRERAREGERDNR